jgi:HSP20 family protein
MLQYGKLRHESNIDESNIGNQRRTQIMAMIRWDPFRELATLQDNLNRLATGMYGRRGEDDAFSRGDWIPPVDIYHTDGQEIVLKAELPGLKREDIDLRVENNTLTLRGQRKHDSEVKEDNYHRVERAYGSFSRSFTLPNTVDAGKVQADYRDGVLTVTLPMREEAKPKQIQVQVG